MTRVEQAEVAMEIARIAWERMQQWAHDLDEEALIESLSLENRPESVAVDVAEVMGNEEFEYLMADDREDDQDAIREIAQKMVFAQVSALAEAVGAE